MSLYASPKIGSNDWGNIIRWHGTDRELDREETGECTCQWCIYAEMWKIVTEHIDLKFDMLNWQFDLAQDAWEYELGLASF